MPSLPPLMRHPLILNSNRIMIFQFGTFSSTRWIATAMLTFFASVVVSAQSELLRKDIRPEWESTPLEITAPDGVNIIRLPAFKGAAYTSDERPLPYLTVQCPSPKGSSIDVRLDNARYESYQWPGNRATPRLGNTAELSVSTGYEKGRPLTSIAIVPLRNNPSTGQLERLVSGTLVVSASPSTLRLDATEHVYADQSQLADGTWYKVSVTQTGIYRIDKAFLESLGINTTTLNAATLGIFGYGIGMLPEANSADNPDDLVENAVYRVGLADGSFDDGDYILWYAVGPHTWEYDTALATYRHTTHPYSNKSCYFISPNRGTNKSLTIIAVSPAVPTYTSTSFDHLVVWDNDDLNLIRSGRRFFDFGFNAFSNLRTYSTTIPNIITDEPALIRYFLAAKSSAGASTFTISGNGLNVSRLLSSVPESTESNYASSVQGEDSFLPTNGNITFNVSFAGPAGSDGWLDDIELVVRRSATYNSGQLLFRDSRGIGEVTRYLFNGPDDAIIWDVTDPTNAAIQAYFYTGGQIDFTRDADSLLQFIAFFTEDALPAGQITIEGPVANQNLHNSSLQPDLIIVSHPDYMAESRRLAAWHHNVNGLDTLVASTTQVYNEFSSGTADITAIRNMMRMFYDRAAGSEAAMPQYLLLMGDATFDYKNIMTEPGDNTNRVPTYQSYESIHQVLTFPTDDYYVCLDPEEGADMSQAVNLLDVAVGRLPVKSVTEARNVVDKILAYKTPSALGSWRNTICFVADDEDGTTHIDDANDIADWVNENYPQYNINKIYLDAYQQVPGAGGERYPDVNRDINAQIFTGSLIMNWTGHGNEQNWAQERVLGVDDINSWTNFDKLPLFITATCSFSRYDNPERTSAGELILLNPQGGGIGLVTTVRIVYSFQNYVLNSNFFFKIFEPVDGRMPTMGEALTAGKNSVSTSFDAINNRKFLLLGDPALQLNYPQYQIVATEVNGTPVASGTDTLKALAKVNIKGEIRDGGSLLSSFNGIVYPTIFDKPLTITTLENDPATSNPYTFTEQSNVIYKGKASVTNGAFEFEFIVPKDISYTFGNGKLSFYAENGVEDAGGYENNVIVGGASDSAANDLSGPEVSVYMNDETFVFGGLTDENPLLYIVLEDENGINTVGNGIGHDIMARINDDDAGLELNDYYESDLDSYQSGKVSYPLYDLPAGRHAVRVEAWDVYNNSGEGYTEFVVAESAELALDHVLNYPNPFTTNTEFWFEHNRPGDVLDVKVEIFTVSGKLIKTILQQVSTDGYRVSGIGWDGLDNFGDPIGRGVYVYKISVRALSDNAKVSVFEKLVVLR